MGRQQGSGYFPRDPHFRREMGDCLHYKVAAMHITFKGKKGPGNTALWDLLPVMRFKVVSGRYSVNFSEWNETLAHYCTG